MSHYYRHVLEMHDRDLLVKALLDCGFSEAVIEIHETAQTLYDWHGKPRPQKAHVIVRRKNVARNANDVGFEILADGTIAAHISEYDQQHGRVLNAAWRGKLGQRYQFHTAVQQCERLRRAYTVTEQQDGSLHIRVRH